MRLACPFFSGDARDGAGARDHGGGFESAHGMGEVVALAIVAAHGAQEIDLGGDFKAFGDDFHSEIVGQFHHGMKDRGVIAAGGGVADEGAVDLQYINGETMEVGEGRVSRAEIVHVQANAEILDTPENGFIGIAHDIGFGDFELEAIGVDAGVGEDIAEVGEEVGIG